MRAGISTACLYPMQTERSLTELISRGFQVFEIFFNTYSEITADFTKELYHLVKENGCVISSVHPFTSGFETMLLFSDYERRFYDGLEFYKQYFEAANVLGAKILVLHGERDYHKNRITEEEYIERYAQLRELGKKYRIDVAQENVNEFRSEDPAFIYRMKSYLKDDCSFVLDIKQTVRAGFHPLDMCDAMGDRLIHLHFNDNIPQKDCLLPGKGSMNYLNLKKFMLKNGFDGDIIIEVYRNNFKQIEELEQALLIAQDFAR